MREWYGCFEAPFIDYRSLCNCTRVGRVLVLVVQPTQATLTWCSDSGIRLESLRRVIHAADCHDAICMWFMTPHHLPIWYHPTRALCHRPWNAIGVRKKQNMYSVSVRPHLILHVFFPHNSSDDAFVEEIQNELPLPQPVMMTF
jgi:hypothetical protein